MFPIDGLRSGARLFVFGSIEQFEKRGLFFPRMLPYGGLEIAIGLFIFIHHACGRLEKEGLIFWHLS